MLAEIAAHFPPLTPQQVALALGPRWWRCIDAGTLTPESVPDQADPLTAYAAQAPAWNANVREMRAGALAHSLYPLFTAISAGMITLVGVRRPACAAGDREQIPVSELQFRQWSFDASGTLTLHPPGADAIYFSGVRIGGSHTDEAAQSAGQLLGSSAIANRAGTPGDKTSKAQEATQARPMDTTPTTTAVGAVPESEKRRPGPRPGEVDRFGARDRALYPELKRLVGDDRLSLTAAARRLADEGKIAGHTGVANSLATRLQRRFQKDRELDPTRSL
jgi:hypothetical protein